MTLRHFLRCLALFLSFWPVLVAAAPANRPTPGYVRVAIETSVGTIIVAVDVKRAPLTSANFLTYVDDGRFDGVTFYRAARRKSDPRLGLIQGGIDTDARRSLPPVAHEPTSKTGILHRDATLSMARPNRPDSAMGNFFITAGATPNMDARADDRQAHPDQACAAAGRNGKANARGEAVADRPETAGRPIIGYSMLRWSRPAAVNGAGEESGV